MTAITTPWAPDAPHANRSDFDPRAARVRLHADVAFAARVLAPLWPLERFIAINPLGGLERRPFEAAVGASAAALGVRGTLTETAFRAEYARGRITDGDLRSALARRLGAGVHREVSVAGHTWPALNLLCVDLLHGEAAPTAGRATRTRSESSAARVAASVDQQTAKWCAAYFDEHQATWALDRAGQGLYASWRRHAGADRSLPRSARRRTEELPARADDALLWALRALRISPAEQRGYLQTHLACLPGWAGHVRFRAEQTGDGDLVDYLALRVVLEALLLPDTAVAAPVVLAAPAPSAGARARAVAAVLGVLTDASEAEFDLVAAALDQLPPEDRPMVWLDAYEGHYRQRLLTALEPTTAEQPSGANARPAAQLICCIDTRSEGLRRQLEQQGAYETFGFAGFFAVAIRFHALGAGAPTDQCPVLISPSNELHERAAAGSEQAGRRQIAGNRAIDGAQQSFHAAKDDLVAPFALAEASGWLAGPAAAARTFAAGTYGAARSRLRRKVAPPAPTALSVEESFTPDEQVLFAEVALRMMGLVDGFARLVVLCGHGSSTDNNPYASALACGACGGQAGGPNARTAAAILNTPAVREGLATSGIDIPSDTWFAAAEHDTTTDHVVLLDGTLVPGSHQADWLALREDLALAGGELAAERCATLPGAPTSPSPTSATRHARARSTDWAQVYPEWGLAGNAAFIVGPRSMTRGVDLQRRAFLHSYDAAADPTGTGLETILTAPLVVAQWINCQYYFSAVDPDAFGAGTKTTHNVVGGIGVVSGPGGDLRRGLPWQSVGVGTQLVHEPMRLLAAVQAPLARIDEIVARNTVLQQLFGNGWVALTARESPTDTWQRQTPDGWQPWTTNQENAR